MTNEENLLDTPEKRPRADAQRNTEALLEAAKTVFAEKGVDAPNRDIASAAGVGIGTLYRNFPERSDLIKGVFQREVDICVADAIKLSEENSSIQALEKWLHRYTQFLSAKKGLATALHSGDPAYAMLPEYFRTKFEPTLAKLLQDASKSGDIKTEVSPYDLLRGIGNLCVASGDDAREHIKRMINLLIDGLRYKTTNLGG